MEPIRIPKTILERLESEAWRRGLSVEEYIIELLYKDLSPRDKACGYFDAAKDYLDRAFDDIKKGNIRSAADKVWKAATIALRATAHLNNVKINSYGDIWKYTEKLSKKYGDWFRNAWFSAVAMYVCSYEDWCDRGDVKVAHSEVSKMVAKLEANTSKR